LDPRFTGSVPAKNDGFLRVINIHGMISFREEVKPSAPCHKIYDMLKIPAEYDGDTSLAKFKDISCQLPALLLGGNAQEIRK
jgi:hypothetical protein